MAARRNAALMMAGLFVSLQVGCKPTTVVSGCVNFEGQAVKKGSILFQPADGHGSSCGGIIADGQYRLELDAGDKIVHITGMKTLPYDRSKPEQAALADAAAKHGDTSGTYDIADPDFARAVGNRREVKVIAGHQTLDFSLKRPPTERAGHQTLDFSLKRPPTERAGHQTLDFSLKRPPTERAGPKTQ